MSAVTLTATNVACGISSFSILYVAYNIAEHCISIATVAKATACDYLTS